MIALRIVGWLLFLVGIALYAFWAGFDFKKTPASPVAMFTMLGGMILTSGSVLLAQVQAHRERAKQIAEMEETRRNPKT